MFNRLRTLEVFGYDLDLSQYRRTKRDLESSKCFNKKDLLVVDNCPNCKIERQIKLRQSRKNTLCSKCFHNTSKMIQAKQNASHPVSEETREKMRENHWSKRGFKSAFKGKHHSDMVKVVLANKQSNYMKSLSKKEKRPRYIKSSCTMRDVSIERFDDFITPEQSRIRQSAESKAWAYDVLSKANFTCEYCAQRGGALSAHHKNGFNKFIEQRFEVKNGVCLCASCHEAFHKQYGKGNNTVEQFVEWMSPRDDTIK